MNYHIALHENFHIDTSTSAVFRVTEKGDKPKLIARITLTFSDEKIHHVSAVQLSSVPFFTMSQLIGACAEMLDSYFVEGEPYDEIVKEF